MLIDANGREVGSIWCRSDGSVFLPFDPDEMLVNYWSEPDTEATGRARSIKHALMTVYYRLRPLTPRSLQIWVRRRFAKVQARSRFPRWPVETCMHDFCDLTLEMLASTAGEPVPYIAPWPIPYAWAPVLTHDAEGLEGWIGMESILELECTHGVRSSWNLVPERSYEIDLARIRELVSMVSR